MGYDYELVKAYCKHTYLFERSWFINTLCTRLTLLGCMAFVVLSNIPLPELVVSVSYAFSTYSRWSCQVL